MIKKILATGACALVASFGAALPAVAQVNADFGGMAQVGGPTQVSFDSGVSAAVPIGGFSCSGDSPCPPNPVVVGDNGTVSGFAGEYFCSGTSPCPPNPVPPTIQPAPQGGNEPPSGDSFPPPGGFQCSGWSPCPPNPIPVPFRSLEGSAGMMMGNVNETPILQLQALLAQMYTFIGANWTVGFSG